MSWFAIVHQNGLKYVQFGDGSFAASHGVIPQLFNLSADPDELTNLWTPTLPLAAEMEAILAGAVDYAGVALDVAQYQKLMFEWWVGSNADWQAQLANPADVRWSAAWAAAPAASLAAVEAWRAAPVAIQPCRNSTVWPVPAAGVRA